MKKNLAFIILLVSVLFSACEDNRMEGMMDDQFYLLKNGDYILKAYRQKSLVDFEVSIYKSATLIPIFCSVRNCSCFEKSTIFFLTRIFVTSAGE